MFYFLYKKGNEKKHQNFYFNQLLNFLFENFCSNKQWFLSNNLEINHFLLMMLIKNQKKNILNIYRSRTITKNSRKKKNSHYTLSLLKKKFPTFTQMILLL